MQVADDRNCCSRRALGKYLERIIDAWRGRGDLGHDLVILRRRHTQRPGGAAVVVGVAQQFADRVRRYPRGFIGP